MLLKSIKLVNFRQFLGEQEVVFSVNPQKNVTVIMGENGSGKTTFAQAFTWCLYGDTDFTDKSVLNKKVELNLLPGKQISVKAQLELTHKGTEYIVIREQTYSKDFTGKVKPVNTTLNIAFKQNGQQEFVKQGDIEARIKEILPKELSKYFFFDGERIGNLSKQIQKGKSREFSQAVRGLLGLNAFLAAMDHLKPSSKYGVIGSYNESYDSTSNSKIREYTQKIQAIQDELDRIEKRLLEIEDGIQIAEEKCEELKAKINQHSEGQKLQNEKEALEQKVKKLKNTKDLTMGSLLKMFNTFSSSYFALSIINEALTTLSKNDKLDKGIPDMHERTIKFLIERGTCICGNKIEFNNNAYIELVKALEYLPPKSIGVTINQFIGESESRVKSAETLFDQISNQYRMIRENEEEIDDTISKVKGIEEKLIGSVDVAPFQIQLSTYHQQLKKLRSERDGLIERRGDLKTNRDRLVTERTELTLRDENNRKIEIYKMYAEYMYEELSRTYKENEDKIRERLEDNINEIFKRIYVGGMSLSIDDDYNIQVIVNDTKGNIYDVETSTAQSISVIFAFISGIIKIARENSDSKNEDAKMLESEPYPLVMDAPLSAFDKQRIKTVCDALPKVAEQVIIFIKDTDGDIAEQNMGQVVGKRYLFEKKNEFETTLMPR